MVVGPGAYCMEDQFCLEEVGLVMNLVDVI